MATTTIPQPNVINTQAEYTTKKKEVAFGTKINEKGEKESVVLDIDEAQKLEAEEKFEGSAITVTMNLPSNWAAIRAFENGTYVDEEGKPRDINDVLNDLVTLFRVGMTTKAVNRYTQRLLEKDKDGNFTFSDKDLTNGVYDVTAEITSASKRKFKTEEQKTWDSLSNLPKEVRENMWKVYLSANGKDFYIPAE
jgi:hypothetical protein